MRADEVDRQQAAALAIRKEQQAAQQREQEEEARRAQQLEAKAEEEKRQAKAKQEAIELEARREAEEAVRDAALVARQKQAAQLAAAERAQEVAARQKAEAAIGEQRERDRMIADDALAKAAPPGEVSRRAEPPTLPRNLSGGDLVSRALQQARQLDAPRSEPKAIPEPVERTESPRRRTLLGSEQDIGLRMYFESWRLKIERNGNLNYTQSSKDRARGHPVVTVVIRSDGSVDGVFINRSSGVPELDEAVRRIVQLNARYSAFPPELARRYDVIEIRRTWNFEDTLRILEEVR
jgi:TonB family protein